MPDPTAEGTLLEEAMTLIKQASEREIPLRLVGGLAIQVLTPELPPRTRSGQDLDFASSGGARRKLTDMLAERGYVADKNFNALYGDKQLYFAHAETGLAIDVLVDKFHMCHTLEFGDRLTRMPLTLDPMDLLLSKLQIFELNEKDADDCIRLLVTFPLVEHEAAGEPSLDLSTFRSILGEDWGWWKTVTMNLARIRELHEGEHLRDSHSGRYDAGAQLDVLVQAAEDAPKSRRWKLRAKVGERKRWYELPEEAEHHH